MTLLELVAMAEEKAEDWGEFRIEISMSEHGATERVFASFSVDKGILTLSDEDF